MSARLNVYDMQTTLDTVEMLCNRDILIVSAVCVYNS
jgi:hypothetical protein